MPKTNVSKLLSDAKKSLSAHSPEILTGMGIAGMIGTTIFAVQATAKAVKLLEEKKKELRVEKLKTADIIKTAGKLYIPSIIMCTISTTCLIGASTVSVKRNAALAAAYKLSENALIEYREKVIETLGEKKETAIRDKINKDRIDENPVSSNTVIVTNRGNTLCYDHLSKRYFYSDINKIEKAVNELNRRMRNEIYISLNDFYDEIGLEPLDIGDRIGWNIDRGYIDVYFGSQIADDGTPCIVIDHRANPQYDYDKLF